MSELNAESSGDVLTITFDEGLYPKDAIYGAAYIFIDRCYLHLDRIADGKIAITLRRKAHVKLEVSALAGEFENELLGQAWRRMITEENREMIQQITTRAMAGAAGPPGLDDLLTFEADAGAFEDPLGIAMSWEEKYKKKTPAATDGAPSTSDEPAANEGSVGAGASTSISGASGEKAESSSTEVIVGAAPIATPAVSTPAVGSASTPAGGKP